MSRFTRRLRDERSDKALLRSSSRQLILVSLGSNNVNRLQIIALLTLQLCNSLAQAEKPKAFIFTPSNGAGPFPVAVWLHGYRGYSPLGYFPGASQEAMQKQADAIGAVIVGFPGNVDLGDGTQRWAEQPEVNHSYIQQRLKEIEKTANLDLKRVALFGFSQGAMVAGDVAMRYPESYLGAILMSPGGLGRPKLPISSGPFLLKQVFFCFCGAGEKKENVELTNLYAKYLDETLGAKVTLKLYPDISKHARPPDFMEKFPEWMSSILTAK